MQRGLISKLYISNLHHYITILHRYCFLCVFMKNRNKQSMYVSL